MWAITSLFLAFFLFSGFSNGSPINSTLSSHERNGGDRTPTTMPTAELRATSNCFPGFNFKMPEGPPSSLTNWWCDSDSEYAFVGFSYEVTACEYSIRN